MIKKRISSLSAINFFAGGGDHFPFFDRLEVLEGTHTSVLWSKPRPIFLSFDVQPFELQAHRRFSLRISCGGMQW